MAHDFFPNIFHQTAFDLVSITHPKEVFDQLGKRLHELLPNSFVLVLEASRDLKDLWIRSMFGLEKNIMSRSLQLLGKGFLQRPFPILDDRREMYFQRAVVEHSGGLSTFAQSQLSHKIAMVLEKWWGIQHIYTLGLIGKSRPLGNVHVFSMDPEAIDAETKKNVESLTFLFALALERSFWSEENQRSLQKLQQSEEQFRQIFENSPLGIILYDPKGNPRLINPSAMEILQVLKVDDYPVVNLFRNPFLEEHQVETLKQSQPLRFQFPLHFEQFLPPEKLEKIPVKELCLDILMTPIVQDGKLKGILSQFSDITELQKARKTAEKASEEKTRFLSVMSHEIRTPLGAISGLTELTLQGKLEPSQRELVEQIQLSSTHLREIVNEILDFSRIESGKLLLAEKAFDLAALVLQALSMENPRCQEKGVALFVEIDTCLPRFVVGDPVRIRQVLVNLLANAIKFTQRGSITLTLKRETPENPNRIRFAVRDTGAGIEEEDMAHLFESFFRSSSSRISSTSGTGLGLPITREIIQRMSGEIHVESTPGSGSNFWFVLPLEADEQNPSLFEEEHMFQDAFASGPCTFLAFQEVCVAVLPENDTHVFPSPHVPLGERKILIVEDNPVNQLVLDRMIQTMGIPTLCVADGGQALEAWKTENVAMVFMDIHMPRMDGFETTRAIRSLESPEHRVPIVALTAGAFLQDKEKCLQSGMDEFMTKPFSFRQVVQLVTRFFPGFSSYDAPVQPDALAEKHDPAFFRELLEAFLSQFGERMERIRFDFDRKDLPALFRDVHALKGSAASIGALPLQNILERLEKKTQTGCPSDEMGLLREQLEKTAARTLQWIQEKLSRKE